MPQSLINSLLLFHLFGLVMSVQGLPVGTHSTEIGIYILCGFTAAVFSGILVVKRVGK